MNIFSQTNMICLLNSIESGLIFVNDKYEIIFFNRTAGQILDLKAETTLNKHISKILKNFSFSMDSKTEQQLTLYNKTILINTVPVSNNKGYPTGAVIIIRDITELKKLKEQVTELKGIESLLKAIINSTQDAISVVDAEGKGILFNPAYTKLTGLKPKDVLGKPATVDIAEGESMHFKALKTRKPIWGTVMKVGPNKKEVVVNVAPIIVEDVLKGSVAVIHDISEIIKLSKELEQIKKLVRHLEAKFTFDDIIGKSSSIVRAIEQAKKAADTPATVLLRGESGTGKELFAHAIHNGSQRKFNQFIRVNCAAISGSILESELFGYVEGAFTGALRGGKKGLFEEANKGTIFLDEIAEIDLGLQSKLLRVLQEKEIIKVGATKPINIDVRIIAATNKNLEDEVREGKFRRDLYYRLNVVPIFIPPLRQRKEDIPLLVDQLIRKYNQEYGRSVEGISESALNRLINYQWPGNVRELENVISRAIINMKFNETIICKDHIHLLENNNKTTLSETNNIINNMFSDMELEKRNLKQVLENVEKNVINYILKKTNGNKTETAKKLGIATRSLYYKIEKYHL